MLTVLVSTISHKQVFLLKMCVAFANAKATHIFSAKILANMYIDYTLIKVFNDTIMNGIVSLEQLGNFCL